MTRFANYKMLLGMVLALVSNKSFSSSLIDDHWIYPRSQEKFDTLQELIDNHNANADARLSDCLSRGDPSSYYSCSTIYIVQSEPDINYQIWNGMPSAYHLIRESYHFVHYGNGTTAEEWRSSGGLGSRVTFSCPSGYENRDTNPPGPEYIRKCIKPCDYGQTYSLDILECTDPPKKCPQNPEDGNPVELSTGRKFQHFTDYQNSHIQFTRAIYQNEAGAKWHFSVQDRALIETSLPDLDYIRYQSKGSTRFLQKIDDTCWRAAGEACALVTLLPEGRIRIQEGQTLSEYDQTGRKLNQSLMGNAASLVQYTYSDNAIQITSGTLTVTAQLENGQVTSLVTPEGEIDYSYNSAGLLSGVTFPGGGSEYYTYRQTGLPVLTEFGRNNQPFAFWSYDNLNRVTRSWHQGEYDSVSFAYGADYVTTTNPLGKTTRYNFVQLADTRIVQSVAGEASANCAAANKAYTYFPNGTLQSKTDWSGNLTTYVRDNFGRETSRTEAAGTPQARTITTEYHPTLNLPVQITEPGKVTVMTYDADGRLLSQNIQSTTP